MEKKAVRIFSVFLAVVMLTVASFPSYAAATTGAETFYQIVSPLYFAWSKYHDLKTAHSNSSDSDYTGYNPKFKKKPVLPTPQDNTLEEDYND